MPLYCAVIVFINAGDRLALFSKVEPIVTHTHDLPLASFKASSSFVNFVGFGVLVTTQRGLLPKRKPKSKLSNVSFGYLHLCISSHHKKSD